MASTGGTSSYSPISMLTGTTLLAPKPVAKPAVAKSTTLTAAKPVTLSSIMSSSGSPSSTATKKPAAAAVPAGGLDQFMAQRRVAPAQQAQKVANAWETGALLPIQKNTITGERRLAMPGFMQSAIDAFKLPGDVLSGRNQNFTPGYATAGGIADALNFTGNFAGAGSVVPRPAGSLGIFGNELSPLFNKAADQAARNDIDYYASKGMPLTPDEIWTRYGLEYRPQQYGGTVFEIPGAYNAGVDLSKLPPVPKAGASHASSVPLKSFFDYPELFAAGQNAAKGPIADMRVAMMPAKTPIKYTGAYSPAGNYMLINPNLSLDELMNVLFHEGEHGMQYGFNRPGGSAPGNGITNRQYLTTVGEGDARLSEMRQKVSPNQLTFMPLSYSRMLDQLEFEPKLAKVGEAPKPGDPLVGSVPWLP